jgi:two-component system, sensor histidine kinase YesM
LHLIQHVLELINVRKHVSARVFLSIFIALFTVSVLLTGAYSFSAFNDITNVVISNGQSSVETIAVQMDTAINAVAQIHALLYSSEYIYNYLYNDAKLMPSYEWFKVYNAAQKTLQLCGRSQTNLIMGMMIYRSQQESIQYGSFYTTLNPYTLDPSQLGRLLVYNGSAFYVSSFVPNSGIKTYLVTQIYNSVFDTISSSLLSNDSSLLFLDREGNIFRQYTKGDNNAELIRTALLEGEQNRGILADKWHLVSSASSGGDLVIAMAFPVVSLSEKLMEVSPWLVPALLSSFMASIVLSYGISRRLAGGFRTMQENISLMEQEKYSQIKLIPSQDELGHLSHTFARMALRISALISENQEKEHMQHELEMQVLRAQVSPHFLYNALNNMRQLAAMQGMDHIVRMITALINLLRAALTNEGLLIPLSQELEYVKNYFEICKYQYLDDFVLDMKVDEDTLDLMAPQMVLQPIVENAVIHGISKNSRKGIIRVYAKRQGDLLCISVVDNGQGMDKEQLDALLGEKHNTSKMRFSGIGVHNVHERIRLRFGNEYGLHLSSRLGAYTKVDILLPAVQKEEST